MIPLIKTRAATIEYVRGPCPDIELSAVSSLHEARSESWVYPVREPQLELLAVDNHIESRQHGVDRIGDGEVAAGCE